MEQTIGRRIMENRKRLGLTQDQLAERLGVTAQAVSKWENDQSCPDITTLPKLAEIFGTSTDELLGCSGPQKVYEAEVVSEDDSQEKEGIHVHKGGWEFQWDAGRRDGIAFAVFVLLVGTLTLLSQILQWGASLWDILWPSAMLIIGLRRLLHKFSFFGIGCTLFGGYFLIENLNIWELNMGSNLIFPIVIVIFGLSLLADALRKPRQPRFHVSRNGVKLCDENGHPRKGQNEYITEDEGFTCNFSFGEGVQAVALPRLSTGIINMSFGELTVDFTDCEEIADGCMLEANCSFGELVLLVPKWCRVLPESRTAFASLAVKGEPDPEPVATMYVKGKVSFGEILVKYV